MEINRRAWLTFAFGALAATTATAGDAKNREDCAQHRVGMYTLNGDGPFYCDPKGKVWRMTPVTELDLLQAELRAVQRSIQDNERDMAEWRDRLEKRVASIKKGDARLSKYRAALDAFPKIESL
jgi:hypothetical protein